MPKRHPKRWTILAIASATAVLSFSGASAAWAFASTACSTVENPFSIISCKASIIEDFQPPQTIIAGAEIVKKVAVLNEGESDCFVRASVSFEDENCKDWASISFNSADWEDGDDGYRYLKTALAPGLENPPVCTQVVISPDASKAQIRDFNVIAFCETTPTKGRNGAVYSNAQEAFAARKESR